MLTWLRKKRVWIPLAVFTAYGLFGFLILPGILRDQIVKGIRENLKREARLAQVRVNPYFLSLTLEGFGLEDPDGTTFVAFDRLHVDLQFSSLVRWAITLREFSIDGPKLHVRLMPDGQTNFADLIPKEQGPPPPRLIIGNFRVSNGSVRVTNLMAAEPEDATFVPIDLDLTNFTTIPRKEGLYQITARDHGNGSWQWRGDLTFEPMHSAGVLEISRSRMRRLWEVAKNRVPFEIMDGHMSCRLQYQVDVRGDSLVARVDDSSFGLAGLALRQKGVEPNLLELDSLAVTGIGVRYPEQSAAIDRVLIAGTRVRAWLNPDTTLNWLALMTPPAAAVPAGTAAPGTSHSRGPGAAPDTTAGRDTTATPAAWTVTLREFAIRDFGLDFEDRTTDPVFQVAVAPVNVTVRNISSEPGAKFDVATDVTIAGKGQLDVSGIVSAQPPGADLALKLTDFPLAIFQPYVNPLAKLTLISGTLGFAGDVHFEQPGAQPDVRFTGNVESRNFLTRDRLANERFLAWKSFAVNGIEASPARLRVGSVRLTEPYAKVLIHRDRTTNIQDILMLPAADSAAVAAAQTKPAQAKKQKGKKGPKAEASPTTVASASAARASSAPPIPVRIGAVEVVNGSADFADFSLILPFAARIEKLKGTVTGLSSDSAARADVALDGALQPSGAAQVRGQVNPLTESPYVNLNVVFRDFNMPVLTPYTGQFIGREVDKGKMSLDLSYQLEGKHLIGENKILLDQFELGEKVESPEATKLPVGLAIAILKDGEGKIELDVPVEGDVDDPKFRIGRVIMEFLMSLLKKVATAPFALLGALFGGGGDELSHTDFAVGSSAVAEEQMAGLSQLAEALGKRPQLSLEIRGRADSTMDASALRAAKFAALANEKTASDPKRYGGGLGYSLRLLEDLYVEQFGKKGLSQLKEQHRAVAGELPEQHPQYKAGSKKTLVDEQALAAAIQETLTAQQPADEADLLSLANARANAIKLQLMERGIDEARVYVLDPEPGHAQDGKVRVDLSLTD